MKSWINAYMILGLFFILVFFYWQNNGIATSHYKVETSGYFKGFKMLQISDLHNEKFGKNNLNLIGSVAREKPDVIVITGDLIDSRKTDMALALKVAEQLIEIAPIYYVPGNHEARIRTYPELVEGLKALGVHVLHNQSVVLTRGSEEIRLYGVKDPAFFDGNYLFKTNFEESERFKVLLSHRPELLEVYASKGFDLVFSGHAHGGQFRLPFIGGLYAPNQGVFPKITSGVHTKGKTHLVVSRGLGNSLFPLRLFNRPEIVCVTFD